MALNKQLAALSKEELVSLIQNMLERRPDLKTMVALAPGGADIDAGQIRRMVDRIVSNSAGGSPGYRAYDLMQDVDAVLERGRQFANQARWADAARIYQVVSSSFLRRYEKLSHINDTIGLIVDDCVAGLERCLESCEIDDAREDILAMVLDIYQWEVEAGGQGIGEAALPTILRHATPSERKQVANWVRAALSARVQQNDNQTTLGSWQLREYGTCILDLEGDFLDDNAYLRTCRDAGLVGPLTERLLERGRHDEAIRALRTYDDYDVVRQIDRFVRHGATGALRGFVRDRVANTEKPDFRLLIWLIDDAAARNDHEDALRYSMRYFDMRPSAKSYEYVRKAAQSVGRIEMTRESIIEPLRKKEKWTLLTELHLAGGDIDAAIRSARNTSNDYWKVKAAQAAEEGRPRAAVELYLEAVHNVIKVRGRQNYSIAAGYLGTIREIFIRRDDMAPWNEIIATVRDNNRKLRAFQDELDKAGL